MTSPAPETATADFRDVRRAVARKFESTVDEVLVSIYHESDKLGLPKAEQLLVAESLGFDRDVYENVFDEMEENQG